MKENKDKTVNRVFFTKDYSKFKPTRGNRPIDRAHVDRIKKAIARDDLKLPIYVTKGMEIREGHHTFDARKELDLGIFYIIIESEDALDMAIFNAGRKNWSMFHYLNFFCMRNKQDYQIVKSKKSINSPHLILLEDKKPKIKKPTKVIKKEKKSIKEGWHDASA